VWERLHQHSVCDPALEILDEVYQSNLVDPVESSESTGNPKNLIAFRALEQSNKDSQIVFIDCSLFLIG